MNPPPRSRNSRRTTLLRLPIALALAAGVLTSASLSGCGEEPPPPPPPPKPAPPPPPPPPPEISIQALLQEEKADARVTFADSVTITDEALARAVIALADGFARGDAAKLNTVLTDSAKIVLGTLDATGEWATATSGIEAVRVVYVGDAGNAFVTEADPAALAAAMSGGPIAEAMTEAMAALPADKQVEISGALAKAIANPDPEALSKALADAGIPAAAADKLKAAIAGAADTIAAALNAGGAPQGPIFLRAVVLAVQDAKGAFLLGWGVDDTDGSIVRFGNAPTAPVTKPRASDFDTIGLGAFGTGEPALAAAGAEPKPEGDPATPEDPNDPAPRDPNRKNTPGGPITVPGGS